MPGTPGTPGTPGAPGAPGAPGTPGALGAGRIREKTRTCAHALRLILPSNKKK